MSGGAVKFHAGQAGWHAIHASRDSQPNVPDKALIVHNFSRQPGLAALPRRYRVAGGGGNGDADVGGGGGNTLSWSCGGACSGAAIEGSVGPCVDAGLGAAGLGRATVARGLGFTLRGGGAGGGSTWSAATTGLGTRSGGGLLNQEPSAW